MLKNVKQLIFVKKYNTTLPGIINNNNVGWQMPLTRFFFFFFVRDDKKVYLGFPVVDLFFIMMDGWIAFFFFFSTGFRFAVFTKVSCLFFRIACEISGSEKKTFLIHFFFFKGGFFFSLFFYRSKFFLQEKNQIIHYEFFLFFVIHELYQNMSNKRLEKIDHS